MSAANITSMAAQAPHRRQRSRSQASVMRSGSVSIRRGGAPLNASVSPRSWLRVSYSHRTLGRKVTITPLATDVEPSLGSACTVPDPLAPPALKTFMSSSIEDVRAVSSSRHNRKRGN